MSGTVDQALVSYRGLVESLALVVSRSPSAKRVGAEYDDLVQEGLLSVWQTTARGNLVSKEVVRGRMQDWINFLGKRSGEAYSTHLPLDDFRNLARQD